MYDQSLYLLALHLNQIMHTGEPSRHIVLRSSTQTWPEVEMEMEAEVSGGDDEFNDDVGDSKRMNTKIRVSMEGSRRKADGYGDITPVSPSLWRYRWPHSGYTRPSPDHSLFHTALTKPQTASHSSM